MTDTMHEPANTHPLPPAAVICEALGLDPSTINRMVLRLDASHRHHIDIEVYSFKKLDPAEPLVEVLRQYQLVESGPTVERCELCHGEGTVERSATPEEVDAGCELGIAFDPCPQCRPRVRLLNALNTAHSIVTDTIGTGESLRPAFILALDAIDAAIEAVLIEVQ